MDEKEAETIEKSLWLNLGKVVISKLFALSNWSVLASDGACVMIRKKSEVATKLCEKITHSFIWHYLCQHFKLSAYDVIKDYTGVSYFQSLKDIFYVCCHQSPKNPKGLDKSLCGGKAVS